MIAHLEGIHETVDYRDQSGLRLYNNDDFEKYPKHWHTCLEIIMPVQNTYMLNCDGNRFHMQEGDILVICPGCLHTLEASQGQRYIFQAEMTPFSAFGEVKALIDKLYPAALFTPATTPAVYPAVREMLETIVKEYNAGQPLYGASIYARLTDLFVMLSRQNESFSLPAPGMAGTKQREYIEKFTDVCDYINEHCCEDLTLEMMAARAGFSKFHFTRLFKEFANVSFYRYLNQRRIEHASVLLINPENSVTSVSLASGFTSQSSFIRMFKILKGCTPSAFREMYNNNAGA